MKRMLLLLISALLLASCSATAMQGTDSTPPAVSKTESYASSAPESTDTQSEPVVTKVSLSEREIALLNAYLTAYEGDFEDFADFRAEAVFCGVYGKYTVAFCGYEPWGKITDGVIESLFPYEPLRIGVYLIDGEQVISLEKAIADGIDPDALESMLPASAVCALNRRPAEEPTVEYIKNYLDDACTKNGWQKEDYLVYGEPTLLGVLDGFDIVRYQLMSTYVTWEMEYLPEGWSKDYLKSPAGASRCGVYAIRDGEVLRLEDAVGTELEIEEVYELLPMIARCYLDMVLGFPFAEDGTITGVK